MQLVAKGPGKTGGEVRLGCQTHTALAIKLRVPLSRYALRELLSTAGAAEPTGRFGGPCVYCRRRPWAVQISVESAWRARINRGEHEVVEEPLVQGAASPRDGPCALPACASWRHGLLPARRVPSIASRLLTAANLPVKRRDREATPMLCAGRPVGMTVGRRAKPPKRHA